MGQISEKLARRLGRDRRLAVDLRRGAEVIPKALGALERGEAAFAFKSGGEGLDPLHAVYVAIQNATSVFSERVSRLPEFRPFYRLVVQAEDDYLPDGPPISPLTRSYFTSWAFFDLRFGPDRETIGSCLLDVAEVLGLGPDEAEAVRCYSASRMGIHERGGTKGGRCSLKELITDDEVESYSTSGYDGRPGELWYVRIGPPIGPATYSVVLTTPYVLLGSRPADWMAYLGKSLIGLTATERRRRLGELLKYGREPNHWNEFIFRAYHHHQFDAIFLAGMPDVPWSLPHA